MKQSQLFTKTRKEAPKDEVSKNAELLIRGGFIHKEAAGVYDLLPLGVRVVKKIEGIVRDEMNNVGGQEVYLSVLQDKEAWQKTERWDDGVVDNWFKTSLKNGTEMGLGFTHEEPLTNLMRDHINSYRDLPQYPYQIQTKFRNEARAKSGIMRGREFSMKDLYSFSATPEEHDTFYEQMKGAYKNIFDRVGIGEVTHLTFASGGSFSKYSHEFQTITDAGEDSIFVAPNGLAVNREVFTDEVLADLELDKNELEEKKAVEVGNIFSLGTKFSDALGLTYKNEEGKPQPVIMGSYGIGIGRLMGTVVEVLSDDKGIVWPTSIAPFHVHIVSIGADKQAEKLYGELTEAGVEVLFDDRDVRPGEKLGDSDLLGIPVRIVVSQKNNEAGEYELKMRNEKEAEQVAQTDIMNVLKERLA